MPSPSHIFISYARQDGREYAERLDTDLQAVGFQTWRDTRNINEYQDFSAEIEIGIQNASHVIVCVTPSIDANPQSFVRREIIYADSKKKPIIPLVFPDAIVPTLINHLTWIPFSQGPALDYEGGLRRLHERLHETTRPAVPRASTDPYHDYLIALYDQIVRYLNLTVFSLVTLRSEATPDAVGDVSPQVLPMAFWAMAGVDASEGQGEAVQFSNFHEAFAHYAGRVLLLGEPGAGKTTTLFAFARDQVARRLEDPTLPLPILVPIATWDSQEQTPLADWLASTVPMLKQAEVVRLVKTGNALLLLDGLDELGSEREEDNPEKRGEKLHYDPRVRFLSMTANAAEQPVLVKSPIVVTCRVKDYVDIGEKLALTGAVTLQPLNDDQMRDYLRDLPDLWATLESDAELREVARTPLLLSLFTYAFRELPAEAQKLRDLSRGDLRDAIFETYVKQRYERETRKPNATTTIALDDLYETLGYVAMWYFSDFDRETHLTFESFELVLFDSELTQAFVDLTIQMNILTPNEDGTLRFIHLLLHDYFCFRYSLHHLLHNDDYFLRSLAASALWTVRDFRAIPALIAAVHDPDDMVRTIASNALIFFLSDPLAIDPLVTALHRNDARVRVFAAEKLSQFKDKRVIDALITAMKDSDEQVRFHATRSLSIVGLNDGRSTQAFIAALDDTCSSVQFRAVAALERIGTPEALAAAEKWRQK